MSSFASDEFNKRFDLNAPVGFGSKTNKLEVEIEFKIPQQVSGIIVKKPGQINVVPCANVEIQTKF